MPATAMGACPSSANPTPGSGGGRWYPTLVTLPSGAILAMCGHPESSDWRHNSNTPEIYSPNLGTWQLRSPVGADCDTRFHYPRSHVLPSGQLFCATPLQWGGQSVLYDPVNERVTPVGQPIPDQDY
jgi:hypothetical protein